MVQVSSLASIWVALIPMAQAGDPRSVAPSAQSAGPASGPVSGSGGPAAAASLDATEASHCARAGELIGSNCSYTTGTMARRVIEDGVDWAWEGALEASANDLTSLVAAPFTVRGSTHVIANELVALLLTDGLARARLSLVGRFLEVDGVRYVVLTSFKVINT